MGAKRVARTKPTTKAGKKKRKPKQAPAGNGSKTPGELPTEEQLVKVWGKKHLVKLGGSPVSGTKSLRSAIEYLKRNGFPAFVHVDLPGVGFAIDFRRVSRGLMNLADGNFNFSPPDQWKRYWVIGDEACCNGSAYWTVDDRNGSVARVDVELHQPFAKAATDVESLAMLVMSLLYWSRNCPWPGDPPLDRDCIKQLGKLMNNADPKHMKSTSGFWRVFLKCFENTYQDYLDEDASFIPSVSNVDTGKRIF